MQPSSRLSRLFRVAIKQFKNLKRRTDHFTNQMSNMDWAQKARQLKQFIRNFHQNQRWKSPQAIAGLLILAVSLGGLSYYLASTRPAVTVIVNGKPLGLVPSVTAGQNLVEMILREQGQALGVIAKTHDKITYAGVRVRNSTYLESVLRQKDLERNLSSYLDAYNLEVNGSVVAVLPTQGDIAKVLQDYQDYYDKPSAQNKITSVSFAEKVNSGKTEAQPSQVQSPDQALKKLLNGQSIAQNYTVKPNDSWWLIARQHDMLTDEVLSGNPGATKDTKLQPGQIIKLVTTSPYLTVVSQGTYTGTEIIPYDVVTKTDYNLGSGQTKVVKQGSNGSKTVTYSYVQNNGIDIKKNVLSQKVIKPPVTKVVAEGPARRPVNLAYNISRGSYSSSTIVEHALSLLGSPYVFGGTTRSGFDCSGFTKYIFAWSGISLPRTSFAQFASGVPVSRNDLKPGDLVFFTTYARGASHVGIYIGGGRFVQADNPRVGVTITSLSNSFYSSRYLGARRYN